MRRWYGGPRPQQHLLAHDGGTALGDRITAPLGERREAFQAARKNRNLVCAIIRLRTSLRAASLGSHRQVLVRTIDKLAAVRDGNPFPAAPGKFTVAIFLDEQPPLVSTARKHKCLSPGSGTDPCVKMTC